MWVVSKLLTKSENSSVLSSELQPGSCIYWKWHSVRPPWHPLQGHVPVWYRLRLSLTKSNFSPGAGWPGEHTSCESANEESTALASSPSPGWKAFNHPGSFLSGAANILAVCSVMRESFSQKSHFLEPMHIVTVEKCLITILTCFWMEWGHWPVFAFVLQENLVENSLLVLCFWTLP